MKKSLLFSILLLTAAGAFAQLTVKPPTNSTDAFIYVKNQILYVEQDINLTKNPTASVEASIYLRDNGQLIQGGTTSANEGDGFLSVQQNTPDTNAWAYYYWCSPVGNPAASGQTVGNNKNFGLNSIYEPLSGLLGTNARMSDNIGSKEGFTEPLLTISKRWMYIHPTPGTEAEGNYIRINASNGAPAGFGFTMKGVNPGEIGQPAPPPNTNQVYEFRGRPNNGDFAIPVMGPEPVGDGSDTDAMMTLTGNPYPSALDLNQVFWEPGNEELSAIFYYDENRSVMSHYYSEKPFGYGVWVPLEPDPYTDGNPGNFPGSYVKASFFIWNAGGGSTSYPGSGGRDVNDKRFAPIGQGFMFVGENETAANVTIKNSHRIFKREGPGSIFFRPTADNSSDEETTTQNDPDADPTRDINAETLDTRMPQLRLYVVFDDKLTRDMLLLFSDQTTDGYDRGYDGLSPGGMKSDVFFPIGDDSNRLPYVIQGTNYDVDKQIPITFKLNKQSKIEVRAVEEINKPYQRAYLFDSQENTYRQLLRATSTAAAFTLPAGTYEDRFYIVFRNPNLRSDIPEEELLAKEAVTKSVNFFQNNPAHQLEVRNPDGYNLKSAAVYDMAGKLVINEKNLGDDSKYSFYTGNLSDGVYLIKLTTTEDITIDYKAIVHNK